MASSEKVRGILKESRIPILPFEVMAAERVLGVHVARQVELGKLNGQAMNESSETWHDNSFADNVRDTAARNTQQAREVLKLMQDSVVVDYPDKEYPRVTVGSIVSVQYDNDPEDEPYLITGAMRSLPDILPADAPDDITPVTLRSPMGVAILGAQVGERIEYLGAHNHKIGAIVMGLIQFQG